MTWLTSFGASSWQIALALGGCALYPSHPPKEERVKNNKDSNKKDEKDEPNVWIWVLGVLGVLVIGVILFFLVKEKK